MTRAQLLANADSMELTKWFLFLDIKAERVEQAQKQREWERKIEMGR